MLDDVLINKAASIERCVARASEEYQRDPTTFATDFTRQNDGSACGDSILRIHIAIQP